MTIGTDKEEIKKKNSFKNQYKGRFAPTPSGALHIGSLVTAIASYLDAKKNNGEWYLRFDDIDSVRVKKGSIESILYCLENHEFFSNESLDTELYFNVINKDEATKNKLDDIVDHYPGVTLRDQDALIEEANSQIQLLLNVIYGFLSISIFVALFGITNTLSLSVYERTREIGLMRAIGTLRKQIRNMVFIESSIISIFGALLGTVLGIFFAWSLIQALEDQGFTEFVVSTRQTLLWIGIAILSGVIAAIIPAIRASRQNILEAISYE